MKLRLIAVLLFTAGTFSCSNPVDNTQSPEEAYPEDNYTIPDNSPDPADRPGGWAGSSGAPAEPRGAAASEENIYFASTKSDFLSALKCGTGSISSTPKIIYIESMIDLLDGRDGDYYVANTSGLSQQYTGYEDYREKFAASCVNGAPAGQEADKDLLYAAQKKDAVIAIPSNTSILGIGNLAGFTGGQLSVSNAANVVIRNVAIEDACDFFPSWYQSEENNFNSEYDNLTVSTSTWVWIDHCSLSDGANLSYARVDTANQAGLDWVTHDGLIDVVRGSNYVTISWNRIENHDKTMLFGNSDSSIQDQGKLKITVHHNYFRNCYRPVHRFCQSALSFRQKHPARFASIS